MMQWPPTLPPRGRAGDYGRTLGDGRVVAQTDSGLGRIRRRLSRPPQPVSLSFELTDIQREALETFVAVDLKGGVLWFEMPAQDAAAGKWVVRINQNMPSIAPIGRKWAVTLDLLRMPQ